MVGTGLGFQAFAGNAFSKDGIGTEMPLISLEGIQSPTVVENLRVLNSIMPAKGETIFLTPRIFGDRFDWINRSNMAFGAYAEIASFKNAPPVKQKNGKCFVYGNAELYAEQWFSNWAYNIPITIRDREINKGVMSQAQAESYYAGKMATSINTMRLQRFAMWKRLFSDVVTGTRAEDSTANSDGTGADVVYEPKVTGYAGKVEVMNAAVPPLSFGSMPDTMEIATATGIVKRIRNAKTWMDFASNEYAKGLTGDDEFTFGESVALIMESATLNAMDEIFALEPEYKGLGMTARSYIKENLDAGDRLVEIDIWDALPTNDTYKDDRLVAVMVDTEAPREFVHFEDSESIRCGQERMTTVDYQGEGISSIYKGLPSYALLAPKLGS